MSNANRSTQGAMCVGKAVIVFDNGLERILIRDLIDGLLIKRGDIESFAKGLLKIQLNPDFANGLGMNARERMLMERTWKKRIDDNLPTYESIAVKSTQPS